MKLQTTNNTERDNKTEERFKNIEALYHLAAKEVLSDTNTTLNARMWLQNKISK